MSRRLHNTPRPSEASRAIAACAVVIAVLMGSWAVVVVIG